MNQSFRGLRETLLQLGAIASDLPRQAPRASQMALARERVADRLALPDVPTPEEQEALHRRFRRWMDGKAAEPNADDWALAPFVYFRGAPPLGRDARFSRKVADLIQTEAQPRILRRAIYAYLRDYSPDEPVVADLGELISRTLAKHPGRWGNDWAARAGSPHRLFTADGLAGRLANEICGSGLPPRTLFRDLGLSTELITHCGLHHPLARELTVGLGEGFRASRPMSEGAVSETLGFLRAGDALRFPDLGAEIANHLLEPFKDAEAPDGARNLLTGFFDRLYGDPRNFPKAWEDVSADAKAVMLRWLVRKSLDLFFDVLSRTADPIWRYRRAFWLALYRHGLIEDAWPAFGSDAQIFLRADRDLRSKLPGFGTLRQAQPNQSVMIMKVRGFMVVEWSHAGACRIWSVNDARAPSLSRADYYATDLRQDCLFSQSHGGTMGGTWQLELSNWIAQRTGVRVPLQQLMANTHA